MNIRTNNGAVKFRQARTMSRRSKLTLLFCMEIFFGFFNTAVSNDNIFEKMSPEVRRSFFGTADGSGNINFSFQLGVESLPRLLISSVPEFEIVELMRPPRSKRSAPDQLVIPFKAFGIPSNCTLNVVQHPDLISRNLTGIWLAETRLTAYRNVVYTPVPDIFDAIGDFDLFQNVEDSSAVTRFWDTNGNENIVGLLKQNYTVRTVPEELQYTFINSYRNYAPGKRSVNSTNDHPKKSLFLAIFKNADIPKEYFRRQSYGKNAAITNPHRSRRLSSNVPDVVYSKLLLIPDYEVLRLYTKVEDCLKQLIAQVNAVDMIYRQLKDPQVHLNIASIIIPRDSDAVPYISKYADENAFEVNADVVLDAVEENFRNEKRRFPREKWDAIFMLTIYSMYAYDSKLGRNTSANGLGRYDSGCTGGAAIATFEEGMQGVHLMAHELAHLFSVVHDEDGTSASCKGDGGYTMVSNFYLAHRLEWSRCSHEAFRIFFSSALGQCTYSRPQEVADVVKSMPGPWLPIAGQCDNLFIDSENFCVDINISTCMLYGCERNGSCDWIENTPLEGSIYDTGTKMACLNSKWQPI